MFLGFVLLGATALALGTASAQTYDGPPTGSTRYWTVPAYPDYPPRGPGEAIGLVLWSHGLSGDRPQYHTHPPALMRQFARAGWDVIKIQRNNLFEVSLGYDRHADDAVERLEEARGRGYRHVILAGQSYGGAISLEAGARTDRHLAVLAFAPGHGSDARNASHARRHDNLTGTLADVTAKQRGPRVLISIADGDSLHPHEVRGPAIRAALARQPGAYVLLDETMPIKGHAHAYTNQYAEWFGRCILDFANPARQPKRPETVCSPPNPIPSVMLPKNMSVVEPGADVPAALARLTGAWSGKFSNDRYVDQDREVCVVFERLGAATADIIYALGAGPHRELSMGTWRHKANFANGRLSSEAEQAVSISLIPSADGSAIDLTVLSRNRQNKYTARLSRGCN